MPEKKFIQSLHIIIDGKDCEYHGEVNSSSMKPEGKGVAFFADGSMFEGRWSDGNMTYGRELGNNKEDLYIGSYTTLGKFNGQSI